MFARRLCFAVALASAFLAADLSHAAAIPVMEIQSSTSDIRIQDVQLPFFEPDTEVITVVESEREVDYEEDQPERANEEEEIVVSGGTDEREEEGEGEEEDEKEGVVAEPREGDDDRSARRLIRTSEDGLAEWMTEDRIDELRIRQIGFVDVTLWEGPEADQTLDAASVSTYEYPETPSHQEQIEPLLEEISTTGMRFFLEEFSTLHRTRYYKSKSGAEASAYLFKQISLIVDESEEQLTAPSNVSIRIFDHAWAQSSIIARFEPKEGEASDDEPVVIVGAHLDSVNQWLPSFGRSPGADDDGSGTTTTLEAFRILVESGFSPSHPVEFHWYSGEEAGLLGSADVSRSYAKEKRNVFSMVQFDMTGYHKPGTVEQIGIITDYTDPNLTTYVRSLVEEYSGLPWKDSACGYGCSDHASWKKAGYPSAFPFEGEFKDASPYVHTTQDTVDNISFDHMAAFVKVAIGYAVELGNRK